MLAGKLWYGIGSNPPFLHPKLKCNLNHQKKIGNAILITDGCMQQGTFRFNLKTEVFFFYSRVDQIK